MGKRMTVADRTLGRKASLGHLWIELGERLPAPVQGLRILGELGCQDLDKRNRLGSFAN